MLRWQGSIGCKSREERAKIFFHMGDESEFKARRTGRQARSKRK